MNILQFQISRKFAGDIANGLSSLAPAGGPANAAHSPRIYLPPAGKFPSHGLLSSVPTPHTSHAGLVGAPKQEPVKSHISSMTAPLMLGLSLMWVGLLLAMFAPDRSQRLADCGAWLFMVGLYIGFCASCALTWWTISVSKK